MSAVTGTDIDVFSRYGLRYSPPAVQPYSAEYPPVAIFLHAAVGIFPVKRKRPGKGDFWGFGREIMAEILENIRASGLMARPNTAIYVTLLGTDNNVAKAVDTLREFNITAGNVYAILTGLDLYVAELPTIHALHLFALVSDPR